MKLSEPTWLKDCSNRQLNTNKLTPEQQAAREARSRAMRKALCKPEMIDDNGDLKES